MPWTPRAGLYRPRPKLPRSRLDIRYLAQQAVTKILHTRNIGRGGVWRYHDPAVLEPEQLSRCDNMFHFNGSLRTWPGNVLKGSVASTAVMGLFNLRRDDGPIDNVRMDTLSLSRWNNTTPDWDTPIFQLYTRGTVDTVTGTAVVGNAGVDWETRDTGTGTRIFGSADVGEGDLFRLDAWTPGVTSVITSVDSDTTLTLATNTEGNTTTGTHAYTITKRWRGGTDDYFSGVEFQGKLYLSNGVDHIRELTGETGVLRALVDSQDGDAVPACLGMVDFAERIFAWGLSDYGPFTENVRTVAWCAATQPDQWDPSRVGAGFREFLETAGAVQYMARAGDNLVVFKEFDLWVGGTTGIDEPPVNFEPKATSPRQGLLARRSPISVESVGYAYVGQDDLYMFTLFQAAPIGNRAIRDYFFDQLSRNDLIRVQGTLLPEFRMAAWLVPLGGEQFPQHVVLWDYYNDVFYGPIQPGVNDLTVMGNFVEPADSFVAIEDLTAANFPDVTTTGSPAGTLAIQDLPFDLGSAVTGALLESLLFGTTGGRTLITKQSETYDGQHRKPILRTAAVNTNAPLDTSVAVRVTLVYRITALQSTPGITCSLSDDDFSTILGSSEKVLETGTTGATRKVYFDFVVTAERVSADIMATGAQSELELLELGIEVTDTGREVVL